MKASQARNLPASQVFFHADAERRADVFAEQRDFGEAGSLVQRQRFGLALVQLGVECGDQLLSRWRKQVGATNFGGYSIDRFANLLFITGVGSVGHYYQQQRRIEISGNRPSMLPQISSATNPAWLKW